MKLITFVPNNSIQVFIVLIVLSDSLLLSDCLNMWTSIEKKQAAEKVSTGCVSPCKIFHIMCKNDGKCRQRGSDCTWYCECPEDCEGIFCEKKLSPQEEPAQKPANSVQIKTPKKKDVTKFDKSTLAKALLGMSKKRNPNDSKKAESAKVKGKGSEKMPGTEGQVCPPESLNNTTNRSSESNGTISNRTELINGSKTGSNGTGSLPSNQGPIVPSSFSPATTGSASALQDLTKNYSISQNNETSTTTDVPSPSDNAMSKMSVKEIHPKGKTLEELVVEAIEVIHISTEKPDIDNASSPSSLSSTTTATVTKATIPSTLSSSQTSAAPLSSTTTKTTSTTATLVTESSTATTESTTTQPKTSSTSLSSASQKRSAATTTQPTTWSTLTAGDDGKSTTSNVLLNSSKTTVTGSKTSSTKSLQASTSDSASIATTGISATVSETDTAGKSSSVSNLVTTQEVTKPTEDAFASTTAYPSSSGTSLKTPQSTPSSPMTTSHAEELSTSTKKSLSSSSTTITSTSATNASNKSDKSVQSSTTSRTTSDRTMKSHRKSAATTTSKPDTKLLENPAQKKPAMSSNDDILKSSIPTQSGNETTNSSEKVNETRSSTVIDNTSVPSLTEKQTKQGSDDSTAIKSKPLDKNKPMAINQTKTVEREKQTSLTDKKILSGDINVSSPKTPRSLKTTSVSSLSHDMSITTTPSVSHQSGQTSDRITDMTTAADSIPGQNNEISVSSTPYLPSSTAMTAETTLETNLQSKSDTPETTTISVSLSSMTERPNNATALTTSSDVMTSTAGSSTVQSQSISDPNSPEDTKANDHVATASLPTPSLGNKSSRSSPHTESTEVQTESLSVSSTFATDIPRESGKDTTTNVPEEVAKLHDNVTQKPSGELAVDLNKVSSDLGEQAKRNEKVVNHENIPDIFYKTKTKGIIADTLSKAGSDLKFDLKNMELDEIGLASDLKNLL